MAPAGIWIEAARPRTLGAGVVPVLVGTAAAERFIAWRFVAALVVGVAVQVAVNYANDLFDARRGVDTTRRVGPRRATAAGLATPVQMRTAMAAAFAVAAAAGLILAIFVGLELLVVGVLCFLAALGYSGGPRPYGSMGLGEIFVFVFFGLVATIGSAYVQDEAIPSVAVLAALPVGLLATAILVVNNLRDIDTDRDAGKRTLAVRMGSGATRAFFAALLLGSLGGVIATGIFAGSLLVALLPCAAAPGVGIVIRSVWTARHPAELIGTLKGTALLQLVVGVLLSAGLWLS